MNEALQALRDAGVSIWLDDLSRERLTSGSLAELVARRARLGGDHQPDDLRQGDHAAATPTTISSRDLAARGVGVGEALRALTTFDVRWACDVLRPVYDATDGVDGRVSIEVDPRLAHDTAATIAEARALWWAVDRPNLFVKIPAAQQGLPAITACLAEGISINVTLIFSLTRYDQVMDAFLDGLERAPRPATSWPASGRSPRSSSPASTPRSTRGWTRSARRRPPRCAGERRSPTRGWPTSATSGCSPRRGGGAAAAGARPQRPLWASTSMKDPAYPDTRYVVDLVAPGVVNTMPEATLRAVADHGVVPGDSIRGRLHRGANRSSTAWPRSASTTTTSCRRSRTTASRSSTARGPSWPGSSPAGSADGPTGRMHA